MGMMYWDYKFKSVEYQNCWRCIVSHTFENMELYYRKQFSLHRLLSYFKKTFHVTPATLKNSTNDGNYKHKLLAIYLLTKYSKEDFEFIAKEFNTTRQTVDLIYSNNTYSVTFNNEIKLFFKQFENDYLLDRKTSLAWQEDITRQKVV